MTGWKPIPLYFPLDAKQLRRNRLNAQFGRMHELDRCGRLVHVPAGSLSSESSSHLATLACHRGRSMFMARDTYLPSVHPDGQMFRCASCDPSSSVRIIVTVPAFFVLHRFWPAAFRKINMQSIACQPIFGLPRNSVVICISCPLWGLSPTDTVLAS